MPLVINNLGPAALELHVRGRLSKEDYELLAPRVEQKIEQRGKVGLLVHVAQLEGWTPAGLWEDLKFDAKHYRDVSRLAVVAEDPKKDWLATLSKPFTAADVEFYPESDLGSARAWVNGEVTRSASTVS